MFLCYYMHFFTFVTEKDRKTLFYRQENDFDQGMACGAPICWSKYTTSNKHTLLKFWMFFNSLCSSVIAFSIARLPRWIKTRLRRMLKAPPLKSSDLHLSVIKYNCQTYNDNIRPNFKKPGFAILGAYNMFNQYRTKVCPEIL